MIYFLDVFLSENKLFLWHGPQTVSVESNDGYDQLLKTVACSYNLGALN